MTSYPRPDLNGLQAPYKGRRYWVVELHPTVDFKGWTSSDMSYGIRNDFVIYDKYFSAVCGIVRKDGDALHVSDCVSHWGIEFDCATLKEAAQQLAFELDAYSKYIGKSC